MPNLILSRKKGESIIAGNVRITVVSAVRVKLAIEAPPEVSIRRGEMPREAKK